MTFKPYPHAPGGGSLEEGLAMLRTKVARHLTLGPYSKRISIGLRRDLAVAVDPPTAKIPVRLRDFRQDDIPALFPAGGGAAAEGERADVEWRLRAAAHGVLPSRCYVLVDERSGRPCHIQWLTAPGYGDAIRRSGALPRLAADEAMLENAFTPVGFRGLGIMAAAVHLIAECARVLGMRHLLAFVDEDNAASLKAAERAGLTPWSIRTRRQFGFGIVRTVRFERIAAAASSGSHPAPKNAAGRALTRDGTPSMRDEHGRPVPSEPVATIEPRHPLPTPRSRKRAAP